VVFKHFGCDVMHKERILWTIGKNWQKRGKASYQRFNLDT